MVNFDGSRTGSSSITVGTSAVVVSQEKFESQRVLFSVINTSTGGQKVTIAIGKEAKAGEGVVLGVGGYYSESIDPTFLPANDEITAIADGAGATIAFQERVKPVKRVA